jgi:hypothetical protein
MEEVELETRVVLGEVLQDYRQKELKSTKVERVMIDVF